MTPDEATGVLSGAVEDFLEPLADGAVAINAVTPAMTQDALKEASGLSVESVIDSQVVIDSRIIPLLLMFRSTEAFKRKTHEILQKAYSAGDLQKIVVRFNGSPVPNVQGRRIDQNEIRKQKIKALEDALYRGRIRSNVISDVETGLERSQREQVKALKKELKAFEIEGGHQPDYLYQVDISAGIMAFIEKEDQYAAVLYLALAMENPATFGALRDERIKSFLDNLQSYKGKAPEEQEQLRISISVMERLVNAGYQPMALARIETDIYDWIRDNIVRKRGYGAARRILPKSIDRILADPTRSLRVEVMNAFNNQFLRVERDMSQITSREFGPEMKAFVRANQVYVRPIYSKWLTYSSPVVLTSGVGGAGATVFFGAETVVGGIVAAVSSAASGVGSAGSAVGGFLTTTAGTLGELVVSTGVLELGGTAIATGGYVLAATAGAGVLAVIWKSRDAIIDSLTSVRMPRLRSLRSENRPRIEGPRSTPGAGAGSYSIREENYRLTEEDDRPQSMPAVIADEGPGFGQRIGHALVATSRAGTDMTFNITRKIGRGVNITVLGIGALGVGGLTLANNAQRGVRVGLWNSAVWVKDIGVAGYKAGEGLVIGTGRAGQKFGIALADAAEKRRNRLRERIERYRRSKLEKRYMRSLISSGEVNPLEISNLLFTTGGLLTNDGSESAPVLAIETDSDVNGTGTALVPVSEQSTELARLSNSQFSSSSLLSFYNQLLDKLIDSIESYDDLSKEDLVDILTRANLHGNSDRTLLDKAIYQEKLMRLHDIVVVKHPDLVSEGTTSLPILREGSKLKEIYAAVESENIEAYLDRRPYMVHKSMRATKEQFDTALYEKIVHEALKADLDEVYRRRVVELAKELIQSRVGGGRLAGVNFRRRLAKFLSEDEMVTLLLNDDLFDRSTLSHTVSLRNNLANTLLRRRGSYSAVQTYLNETIAPRGVRVSGLLTDVTRVNSTSRLQTLQDLETFLNLRANNRYSSIPVSVRKQILRIVLENSNDISKEQIAQVSSSLSVEIDNRDTSTKIDLEYKSLLITYYNTFKDKFSDSDDALAAEKRSIGRVSGNELGFLMNAIFSPEAEVGRDMFEYLGTLGNMNAEPVMIEALSSRGDALLDWLTSHDLEMATRRKYMGYYISWYDTKKEGTLSRGHLISRNALVRSYGKLSFPQRFSFFATYKSLLAHNPNVGRQLTHRWFAPHKNEKTIVTRMITYLFAEQRDLIQAIEVFEQEFQPRSVYLDDYANPVAVHLKNHPGKLASKENLDAFYSLFDRERTIDSDQAEIALSSVLLAMTNPNNSWIRDEFQSQDVDRIESLLRDISRLLNIARTEATSWYIDKPEGRIQMKALYDLLIYEANRTGFSDLVESNNGRHFVIIRTAVKIQELKTQFDPVKFIEVMLQLKDMERKSLMAELFKLYGSPFSRHVFSDVATSEQRTRFFEILDKLVNGTELTHANVEQIVTKSLNNEQRAIWSSLKETYGFKEVKRPWWALFGLESELNKREREIRRALNFQNSVSDVVAYTEVLKGRGARLEQFAESFHNLMIVRPELFRTYEDVMLFLEQDSFWPEMRLSSWDERKYPLEAPLARLIKAKQQNPRANPGSWKYKPAFSERAQNMLIRQLEEKSMYPEDFEAKKKLWIALTNRGVTTVSDRILNELKNEAPSAGQRDELLAFAVGEDRIFDKASKEAWAIGRVVQSAAFKAMIPNGSLFERFMDGDRGVLDQMVSQYNSVVTNLDERMKHIRAVVEMLQQELPERGIAYEEFLEKFSVAINSNEEESAYINQEKFPIAERSRTAEDYVEDATEGGKDASSTSDKDIQAFYKITESIRNWSEEEQYQFIRYIRGEREEPTEFLAEHFPNVGAERLRYIYQELPQQYKVGIMSMFMRVTFIRYSSTDVTKGMPKRIIDDIVGTGDDPSTLVTRALLMAGFVALKNADMQDNVAFIFGQILALEKGRKGSIGETLRIVLQHGFKALGDKIAQQIVAMGILSEEDTIALQMSQDEVGILDREDSYKELRRILVEEGPFDALPFELLDTVGGASMKWATRSLMTSGLEKVLSILKVKRRHAFYDTANRYRVLDYMVNYLIDNYGVEYTILRPIIESAMRGVEREGDFNLEAQNSRRAKEFIYINLDDPRSVVYVPDEQVLPGSDDQIMVSQFAEGTSFKKVPSSLKPVVARKLLEMEASILFADADEITFDPDRHGGNYRIWIKEGSNEVLLEPIEYGIIDHGQHITMTREQRQKVFDLMALSGIYYASGPNAWWDAKVAEIFNMDAVTKKRFEKLIRKYLAGKKLPKELAYHQLISAVYMSGYDPKEVKANDGTDGLQTSIEFSDIYLDLPRAVIQMKQYEAFAPAGVTKPSDLLLAAAQQSGARYLDEYIEHHRTQVGLYNMAGRARSLFSSENFVPLREGMDLNELRDLSYEMNNSVFSSDASEAANLRPATVRTSCEDLFFDWRPAIQTEASAN